MIRLQTQPHDTAAPVAVSRLWFGLGAAPVAWAVAELVGYVMVSRDCSRWRTGLGAYAVPNAPAVLVGLVLVAIVVAAAGFVVSVRSLRTIEATLPPSDVRAQIESGVVAAVPRGPAPSWSRERFMALAGVLVSSLLLLNLVFFGLPAFLVNACSATV